MGGTKESKAKAEKEKALVADGNEKEQDILPGDASWPMEDRLRVQQRLQDSGTGLGLRDFVFDSCALVQDLYTSLVSTSPALREMLEVIMTAARHLPDEGWKHFQEIPFQKVHLEEQNVLGTVFTKMEPLWKQLLAQAKKLTNKGPLTFLIIGTSPPNGFLCDFLTKLGWSGVVVCGRPPPPGNEDMIQYARIDPCASKDQQLIDELTQPRGGLVPKPVYFNIAYVNVVFNQQEDMRAQAEADQDEDEENNAATEMPEGARAPQGSGDDSSIYLRDLPGSAIGYGKVGVTRSERIRTRLRALANSIRVALNRLANDGALVCFWPGLPLHPVLMYLTYNLRKVFNRVHVVSPDGAKTFETYILAVGFRREKAEDPTPGLGGLELKSFFDSTYRREALDDVLMWTLMPNEELEEASIAASGRGVTRGYESLWDTYAEKFRHLCVEMGIYMELKTKDPKLKRQPTGKDVSASSSKKSQNAAPPKENSEADLPRDETQEKAVEEANPARDSAAEQHEPQKADAKVAPVKVEAKEESTTEPLKPKPSSKESVGKGAEASESDTSKAVAEFLQSPPQPKKRFVSTRAPPFLACSLGASPGYPRKSGPDREDLARKWSFIETALDVAKAQNRRFHLSVGELGVKIPPAPIYDPKARRRKKKKQLNSPKSKSPSRSPSPKTKLPLLSSKSTMYNSMQTLVHSVSDTKLLALRNTR